MSDENIWPKEESDYMRLGESGLIPVENGNFFNPDTNETLDKDGKVIQESE